MYELLKDEEELDVSKLNILEILREHKEMKLKGNLYSDIIVFYRRIQFMTIRCFHLLLC